jgi:ABC-2 type transport system permease protein
VLAASLYIIVCSAKNRMRVRLRRLRQPRYLVGAIAGATYLYFTVFARLWTTRSRIPQRRQRQLPSTLPFEALKASGPAFVGIGLLAMTATGWLFPSDSNLLDFTEPEVQFLFPAPVSRRALLIHRLLRSQLGLLFAAVVSAVVVPSAAVGWRLKFALAMWVILVTIKVHFTGITLARASLAMRHAGPRRRQWGALTVTLGAVAIVGGAIARAFIMRPVASFSEAVARLGEATASALPRLILWPFTALAWPLFEPSPGPYLARLAVASMILLVNVVWVLRSDEALQEAASYAEARQAAKRARAEPAPRARASSWTLAPSGRPEMIFLWKNAMQTLRETTLGSVFRYGAPFAVLAATLSSAFGGTRMHAATLLVGTIAVAVAAITVLIGPQMVRTDLRQDLLHLELLKTWPIKASAVVRGEMLWPGVVLTAVSWTAILCATTLWTPAFSPISLSWRLSAAVAAACVAPAVVFAQLAIHNAAAVIFPAWVPLGKSRPRGLDAMGQRLIMFAGVFLALILMIAPAAVAAGIIWFGFHRLIGALVAPAAAVVFASIVLLEVLLATEALGPVYERLDLLAVERAE